MLSQIIDEIKSFEDPQKAKVHSSFFKTAKGQYGEGDLFLGVKVPILRAIAKKYFKQLSFDNVETLLQNPYHEIRATAVFVMVLKFQKGSPEDKKLIFDLYLKNIKFINNWDLVDLSAPYIVGPFAFDDDKLLWELAKTDHLWSQRIAVLSTFYFIRQKKFDTTFALCEHFLNHKQDLIHKATGWMLREIGKRDEKALCNFLDRHVDKMPRTMLRYAIEKFEETKRKDYLNR